MLGARGAEQLEHALVRRVGVVVAVHVVRGRARAGALAAQRVIEDHDLVRTELALVLVTPLGEVGGAAQAARCLHEAQPVLAKAGSRAGGAGIVELIERVVAWLRRLPEQHPVRDAVERELGLRK